MKQKIIITFRKLKRYSGVKESQKNKLSEKTSEVNLIFYVFFGKICQE